jgi:hypothetical protein
VLPVNAADVTSVADIVHDRIITPDTDPDRFTPEEAALFRAGECSWQISDAGWDSREEYCERTSKPGASFGNCPEHDADMLVDHFPDGTPRCEEDSRYHLRPDYQARVDDALAAHQANCPDPDCDCRRIS